MKTKTITHDKLNKYLISGVIFIDNDLYIGKAGDGVEVVIGYVGNENSLENYLKAYPTPKEW